MSTKNNHIDNFKKVERIMIIYKVTNIVNGKCYIGQTSKSLDERKKTHLSTARNKKGHYFHKALRKYGEENFIWEVLGESINKEDLDRWEKILIYTYESNNSKYGYNLTSGGEGNFKHSEKTKQKMREANLRENLSEERRRKLSEAKSGTNHPMYGKKVSEETKQKIREAQLGEKNHMFGKKLSKETRQKIKEKLSKDGVILTGDKSPHFKKINVSNLKQLKQEGYSVKELAYMFNISTGTVYKRLKQVDE